MTPESQKKVVRLYYGFQFFFSLLLWLPIFYEYQRRLGLNDAEIFSIQSIYYVFFCILEVPTGLLADQWGHLNCLKLGSVILLISNLLPILFPNYDGFLWHFLLLAIARSFVSGASSAYLYNCFQKYGKPTDFKLIEGKARAYSLVGKVFCWAGVGFLMQWHLTLPYALTALAATVSGFFAWMLPQLSSEGEEVLQGARPMSRQANFISDFWPVLRILCRNSYVLLIMVQGVAVFVLSRICQVNLFQPLLTEKTFPVTSFGTVMSVMTLFEALGSAYPDFLKRWFNDLQAVFVLSGVTALSLWMIIGSEKAGTTFWLSVFALATGFCFPIQRQLFNDAIPDSRYRATLLSIESIVDRGVCAWVASVLGVFVSSGRTLAFLGWSAAVSGLVLLILFGVARRGKQSEMVRGN